MLELFRRKRRKLSRGNSFCNALLSNIFQHFLDTKIVIYLFVYLFVYLLLLTFMNCNVDKHSTTDDIEFVQDRKISTMIEIKWLKMDMGTQLCCTSEDLCVLKNHGSNYQEQVNLLKHSKNMSYFSFHRLSKQISCPVERKCNTSGKLGQTVALLANKFICRDKQNLFQKKIQSFRWHVRMLTELDHNA